MSVEQLFDIGGELAGLSFVENGANGH